MNNISRRLSTLALGFSLSLSSKAAKNLSEHVEALSSYLGCEGFKDLVWSEIYRGYPTLRASTKSDLEESITSVLNSRLSHFGQSVDKDQLISNVKGLVKILAKDMSKALNLQTLEEQQGALAALELGDRSSLARNNLQERIEQSFSKILASSASLGVECKNSRDEAEIKNLMAPYIGSLANKDVVSGAYKTFATLYQSCKVLDLVPVKAGDANVQGISIVGEHPAGGKVRIVKDAALVARTHHYLKNVPSYGSGCFNVKSSPLIYDFGGKPYASSDSNSTLNFFENGGSGSAALGTDCSGLVFSALASVGLKFKSSTALKAVGVMGISASMMKDPTANGLDCLAPVSFSRTSNLLAGDIIAITGHVVLVDSIGADPFGISRISRSTDCTTSNLPTSRFDFTILQSSPIKNGIGVDRISIVDYLALSSSFKSGLQSYAIKACKAKFGQTASSPSSLAIVRHKGTASCLAPKPIVLDREECVASCTR